MRRKKQQNRLQSIREILYSILKKRGLALNLEENDILKFWPKAVGPQIALQTRPDSLKKGTLFVKTTSPVWVQQLHFMKQDILRQLNKITGKDTVSDIRFAVGHDIGKNKTKMERDLSAARKHFLKERDKKMIAECTEAINDQELAAVLKRVMQTEISRRRWMQHRQGR